MNENFRHCVRNMFYHRVRKTYFRVVTPWWMFVNAAGCFAAAALIYRFENCLGGWKSPAVFVLAPLTYMAAFGFSGIPASIVVNGNYPWIITQLGGLITTGSVS